MNNQNPLTYSNAMTHNRHYIDERTFVEAAFRHQSEHFHCGPLWHHIPSTHA